MGGVSRAVGSRWDEGGRRTQAIQPDGLVFTYAYNAAGQLTGVYQGAGTSVWMSTFAYNAQGLMSARTDRHGGSVAYGYDLLGRPTSQTNAMVAGPGTVTYSLARTPSGQLRAQGRSSDLYAFASANGGTAYAANGLNQYTGAGFAHDANGNLTAQGGTGYVYDIENRLVSAAGGHSASLVYDPLGRLFSVTGAGGTSRFVWDGDALTNEYNAGGNMTDRYVHGAGAGVDDPLVWYDMVKPNFFHADRQGSIVGITTFYAPPRLNAYDEYGVPRAGNVGRFQYTGQLWLPDLGMYHYKARVYSPTLGRFLQVDPVGYEDQFNLYAYVGNDPVNLTDPTGRCILWPTGERWGVCPFSDAEREFVDDLFGDERIADLDWRAMREGWGLFVRFGERTPDIVREDGSVVRGETVDGESTQLESRDSRRVIVTVDRTDSMTVFGRDVRTGRRDSHVNTSRENAAHGLGHGDDMMNNRDTGEDTANATEESYRRTRGVDPNFRREGHEGRRGPCTRTGTRLC